MYKVGDKFVIEIGEEYSFTTYSKTEEQKKSPKDLYRIKGFNSLVFDENGLNKLVRYDDDQQTAYDDGFEAETLNAKDKGYKKGLNDMWEAVRKICLSEEDGGIGVDNIRDIFGTTDIRDIMKSSITQETVEKLKTWEENKKEFNVGDVIYSSLSQTKAIIHRIDAWNIIECIGGRGQFKISGEEKKFWKKTGEHVDLSNIIDVLKN